MENETNARKTMTIRSDSQIAGRCRACLQEIVWTFTKIGARMPMDKGFEVADYVPVELKRPGGPIEVTMQKVYMDQSHFVTCEFADRFRRTKAA